MPLSTEKNAISLASAGGDRELEIPPGPANRSEFRRAAKLANL